MTHALSPKTHSAFSTLTFLGLTCLAAVGCAAPTRTAAPKAGPLPSAERPMAEASPARARTCPGGTVTRRLELEAFAGCKAILGDLTVTGTELTDLAPLARLTRISGKLELSHNPQLRSVSGLERLKRAGSVRLLDNPHLSSLKSLSRLSHLDHLEITGAPALRSSSGLEGLTELESLTLRETGLARVVGLSRLSQVREIEIGKNPNLISLAPLRHIQSVVRLEVYRNPWLNGSPTEFFPELAHAGYARVEDNLAFSESERKRRFEQSPVPLTAHQVFAQIEGQ
jgi:hypothetical protein